MEMVGMSWDVSGKKLRQRLTRSTVNDGAPALDKLKCIHTFVCLLHQIHFPYRTLSINASERKAAALADSFF